MIEPRAARQTLGARFERTLRAQFESVSIAWLAAFRVLFGAVLGVSLLRFMAYGWVDEFFVKPRFHFKYWGFEWVEPLSASGMHVLFLLLSALAVAVAVGLCFRLTAGLLVLGFLYLQLLDVTNYLNHYYLVCLLGLLLIASPAGRAFSLDAWLWPATKQRSVPRLWLTLFRFQVGVVYVFAGLAKAHGDWLLAAGPLTIWLGARTDLPLLGSLFSHPALPLVMSWAGFLFDSTIVLWLSLSKLRPFAYAALIVFHVITGALFPIGMFPIIMTTAALVFFSPDWPRHCLDWLRATFVRTARAGRSVASVTRAQACAPAIPRMLNLKRWLSLALVGGYMAFQIGLPLRYLAYGGNVLWHEQGMRFSWRVMVREKNGSVTFRVRDKRSHRVWQVSPASYLTRVQEREMSTQPDLILQLAHQVQRDLERRFETAVEVRVDAWVSLNGRARARLIDPTVDLATAEDGLGRAAWILPAPTAPPRRLRAI